MKASVRLIRWCNRSPLILASLLMLNGAETTAMSPRIIVAEAREEKGAWEIALFLNQDLKSGDLPAATDKQNYFVLKVDTIEAFRAEQVEVKKVLNKTFVVLKKLVRVYESSQSAKTPPAPVPFVFDSARLYYVFAKDLIFSGKTIKSPLQVKVRQQPASKSLAAMQSPSKRARSTTRKDSNVYIAGELTGASGTDTFVSLDTKADIPIGPIAPFFDLKANTNPKADPDSMKFGIRWNRTLRNGETAGLLSIIHWENAFKIEAERDFDNVNTIWSSEFQLPYSVFGTKTGIALEPFVGFELGKNLDSPLAAAEGNVLFRPLAGARIDFAVLKVKNDDMINLVGSYTRRWPLRSEISFTEDDQGLPQELRFGKGPREYAEAKLQFALGKFFSSYVGYDYGELPPTYKLVDHRFKIGFQYKFKIDRDNR